MKNLVQRVGRGDQEPEVAGIYLLLTLILHITSLSNPASFPAPGWLWLPVLLVGLAAILLRRRALLPASIVMALCGVLLLGLGSIGGYFLVFETVFSLFLLGSARVRQAALILLCLCTVVLAIAAWDSTGDARQVVLSVFMSAFILFTPMLWAENVRTAKALADTEAARAQAVQAAAQQNQQRLSAEHHAARIEERTALAREMHDVLSARLSSIALLSGAALAAGAQEPMAAIRRESVQGLDELTSMVRMLHAGTPALAAKLIDVPAMAAAAPGNVDLDFDVPRPEQLPAQVHTAGHRSVQELLVNHAKHAAGTTLELSVIQGARSLQITASNPQGAAGKSAGSTLGAGIGLENIRTRAVVLGGSCRIEDGERFTVTITLPTEES